MFAGTSSYRELCFHVLAHVPMAGPGSSFDPRYLASLPDDDARAMAIADGRIVAQSLVADRARDAVHLLPELHDSLAGFVATRGRALAELGAGDVLRPDVLAALQCGDTPAFELLHAMLGLAVDDHTRRFAAIAPALDDAAARLAQACAEAGAIAAPLCAHAVELSWALGPRGRGYPGRIVVGAAAPWHGGDAADALVLALHEHHVRDRCVGAWAIREWSALCSLATEIVGAPHWLRAAHARWLATLELDELLAHGVADHELACALTEAPSRRAELLRGV